MASMRNSNRLKAIQIGLVALLISSISLPLVSQSSFLHAAYGDTTTWARTYGGVDSDRASSLELTSDGGYVVAASSTSFSPNPLDLEFWVFKVDSQGNVEWEKTYGGPDGDEAEAIVETSDGGYLVAGETSSFSADADLWLLKLDSDGDIEWEKAYGGSSDNAIFGSIRQTSDTGYIVAATRCDPTPIGGCHPVFWILKLDSEGEIEWENMYNEFANEANSVQETSDGGYIVGGISTMGSSDMRILKLNSTGGVEWKRSYNGGAFDYASSIQQTFDGGFIVQGATDRAGINSCSCVWVVKLDSDGEIEWESVFSPIGSSSIEQTSDGGFVMAGEMSADLLVLKLYSDGKVHWAKKYGGSNYDTAVSFEVNDQETIKETADGGYVVTGTTSSFGAGGSDVLILKIDSEGAIEGCDDLVSDADVLVYGSSGSFSDSGKEAEKTTIGFVETDATVRDSVSVTKFPCGDYAVDLFENGNDPSDNEIQLDQEIGAKAGTTNLSVDQVTFRWMDPNGELAREVTRSISSPEDTFSPAEPGRWTLQSDFMAGDDVIRVLQVNFLVLAEDIIAGIGWDGGGDGVNWSDCENWIGNGCPERSDDVTIGPGFKVNMDIGFVQNSGRIVDIRPGAELTVLSDVVFSEDFESTVFNSGILNIESGVHIFSGGNIRTNAGGTLNNDGSIGSCGSSDNKGTINNNLGATYAIDCSSHFGNSGTFNNLGLLAIGTESTAANTGVINNFGKLENGHDSRFENFGTIVNNDDAIFENGPGASFTNHGAFDNSGTIDNDGSFFNTCGSTFNNSGSITGSPIESESCEPSALCDKPTITGTDNSETIEGTADVDVIDGRGGDDLIYGFAGDDIICGGAGSDEIYGGGNNDSIFGQGGDDTIFGGHGKDTISGGRGDDELNGGAGNDSLSGNGGNDKLLGSSGDDGLNAKDGTVNNDYLDGGSGSDTCDSNPDEESRCEN